MALPVEPNAEGPRPVPGAKGLFVLGVVDLGVYVLTFAMASLSGMLGDGFSDAFFRVENIVWLLFQAAGIALLVPMVRGQKGGAAASLLRTALWLAVVNLVVSVLQSVEVFGGPSLHLGWDGLGLVFYATFLSLSVAFDFVFWFGLKRIAGEGGAVVAWMTPSYLTLRAVAVSISFVRIALPFETARAILFEGPLALPFRVFTPVLHIAFAVIPVVVLHRLHTVGVAGMPGGAPAPEDSVKERAQRDLLIGGLWLGGGLLVTVLSYAAASSGGGGRYVVTTGAIVYGLVRVVRGMTRLGAG
jgi:hypothetical protein